jgi:hypothetical protein
MRIQDLDVTTTVADLDKIVIDDTSAAITKAVTFANFKTALDIPAPTSLGYTALSCLVTQSGTDAPTMTIAKNDLGVVPVWTRQSTGYYILTAAGLFTDEKTFIFATPAFGLVGQTINAFRQSDDICIIFSANATGTLTDSLLTKANFEIRVYE